MAKKKGKLGKIGKVFGAVAGASPLGRVAKMGIAGAKALAGRRGKATGRRRRGLTPEKAFKQIMKLRLKNKILREKMKPLSYIK